MIQNFKTFENMKTKLALKASIIAVSVFIFFAGLIYFIVDNAKKEKGGYYTAHDALMSYNRGYNDGYVKGYQEGAYNTRQAIKAERTDTTIKSCQDK